MTAYILSVLGIVLAGVFIDIIVPSGTISKYIKGIYSIFVIAVLINPVVNFLNKKHDFSIKYKDYSVNENLMNYILKTKAKELEKSIENTLNNEGFLNIDIMLNFSIDNDKIVYDSCEINLKNMVISENNSHINKYEFIKFSFTE